jgi:asparagine synthase (glutamine-hydrolysing)
VSPTDESDVRRMNAELRYRGPDSEGMATFGRAVLGMRRLAIIDLQGATQPLFDDAKQVALVCNGEIYNYVELRAALERRGHRFVTNGDCEVLLRLYQEFGPAFLSQPDAVERDSSLVVRGMFAFVLWDEANQRLLAGRDRFGQKPLYYTERAGGLYLSSEVKTLVRVGAATSAIERSVLLDTLTLTYPADPERTLCTDVRRLAPGCLLVVEAGVKRVERYWAWASSPSRQSTVADFEQQLAASVHLHLRSDVPAALLLSGGLDSAALAVFGSRVNGNMTCISAGYTDGHACDERDAARSVAHHLRLPFVDVVLHEGHAARDLLELSRVCDEPATDIAALAQWALYRRCRELGFRVALSGIGADEMLFGYPECNRIGLSLGRIRSVLQGFSHDHLPSGVEPFVPGRLARWLPVGKSGFLAYGIHKQHRTLLAALDALDPTFDERLARLSDGQKGPASIYAIHRNTYLPLNGLQLADKLGMGNSVEVRVPFVDHELWATADQVPFERRFAIKQSKPLLRQILQRYLPASVWSAPKKGFTPPPSLIRAAVLVYRERVLNSRLVESQFPRQKLLALYQAFEQADRGRWFLYALTACVLSTEAWSE